jgi:MFS family permease
MADAPPAVPIAPPEQKKLALSPNAKRLVVITTLNAFALNSVGVLITPYLRDIGMSAAFVGMYFAISSIAHGIASFVGGFLADSYGRRRIWILGKTLQIAAYAILASGLRGQGMMIVPILSGLSQVGIGAVTAMQADAAQARWRATYFAIVQTANQLIGALAPLVGGLVADRYGAGWAFFGVLPMLLLVARLIWTLDEKPVVRAGTSVAVDHAAANGVSARLASVKQRLAVLGQGILHGPYPRTAIALLAFTVLNGISNGAINIGLPLLLRERFGMGYTGIGAINTVAALGSATCMILGARLADKHGRRRVIIVSGILISCVIWLTPLAVSAFHMYLVVFFATLVGNAANGAHSATAMECIDEGSRATYSGVSTGFNAMGMAVGSVVAGLAFTVQAILPMILAASVITLSSLLMILFLEETGAVRTKKPDVTRSLAATNGE